MNTAKKLSKTKIIDDVRWELTLLKQQKKAQAALRRACLAAGLVAVSPEKPIRMTEKKWEALHAALDPLAKTATETVGAIMLKRMFPKGYLTEEQERKLKDIAEDL